MFRNRYYRAKDYLFVKRLNRDTSVLEPGYTLPDGRQLIVSLTSFGTRLNTIDLTLSSLLSQSLQPSKIILWIAENTGRIPENIRRYEEAGVSIGRCEDLKSYKKLIPCLRIHPDDVIVTADDDTLYPRHWLKSLVKAYLREPALIHCHRAHLMTFDENGLKPYKDWIWRAPGINGPSNRLFPTGVGGVLYPPHCLHEDVTNTGLFDRLAPKADDVWFRIMALLKNTRPSKISKHFREFPELKEMQGVSKLGPYNVGAGGNDTQLKACLEYYGIPASKFFDH